MDHYSHHEAVLGRLRLTRSYRLLWLMNQQCARQKTCLTDPTLAAFQSLLFFPEDFSVIMPFGGGMVEISL